jgi:hypothetical protein
MYCNITFFHPCLCSEAGECAQRFAPEHCAKGRLADVRQLLHDNEVILTSSLSLSGNIGPGESANDTHWVALLLVLA